MLSLPLSPYRVLDLSRQIAGPSCSMMLGDLGAEVIKVERPGSGDDIRNYGPPFLKDRLGRDKNVSAWHLWANRNKKGITVDISKPEGQDIIRRLALKSDVVLENYKVGDLARYGLDEKSLRKLKPDLIYCSVTAYGQTGPDAARPGLDVLFQAASGFMSVSGEPNGPSTRAGFPLSDLLTGLYSAIAVITALFYRVAHHGPGQHIDMALMDASIAAMSNRAQSYLMDGKDQWRQGNLTPNASPSGVYPTASGEIAISAVTDEQYAVVCKAIGRFDLAEDPRFKLRAERIANMWTLVDILSDVFKTRPAREWVDLLKQAGAGAAVVNTVAQAFAEEQVRHRQMVVEVEHPDAGTIKLVRNPIRFSDTPLDRYEAPPDLGQHTDEILVNLLGLSPDEVARLHRSKIV